MAVGDEFGLLAKKMWCSTVPVAHPGGEKNILTTVYRFSRFFVRAAPLRFTYESLTGTSLTTPRAERALVIG